jgi:DNA replication initiation complex subunit (GINS family)
MSQESLINDLERLRREIEQIASNNPDAYRKLNVLISDLENRISDTPDQDDTGLLDRVQNEIEHFETAHPRATAILNDILVTLSNMGI